MVSGVHQLIPNESKKMNSSNTPGEPASIAVNENASAAAVMQDKTSKFSVDVPVGPRLYKSSTAHIPTLSAVQPDTTEAVALNQSILAHGIVFTGDAVLATVFSVAGSIVGNLTQSAGAAITIVVTETGDIKGDITATNISVLGKTNGLLDAGGGSVSLHDASDVTGHVRYKRLQVNGADLNATLEKADAPRSASRLP